jgi:myo-inositol-1(or 4)-monophosphatase
MAHRLEVALAAAHVAGRLLLSYRQRELKVERKGRIDLVSEADRAAEVAITDRLAAVFPNDIIVGEEGAEVPEVAVQGRSRWYVDPLDGTTNYLHGSSRWAVSIAWCSPRDRIEAAVVHLPVTGETFRAEAGQGAHLNGDRLTVTDVEDIEDALICSGFPYEFTGPTNLPEWTAVTRRARSVRCLGAAAIDLCDVARGHLDGFWEQQLGRWDTAAGILIAAEAGARVTDFEGNAILGPAADVVVAGPALHPCLLDTLRSVQTRPTPTDISH